MHDNEAEDALLLEQEDQDDGDAEEITKKEASRAWKKKVASLSRKEQLSPRITAACEVYNQHTKEAIKKYSPHKPPFTVGSK